MAMKGSMETAKLQIEREKIAAARDVAANDLEIARENKNKYDIKNSEKAKNK
jgi:hypothetical protein